MKRLMLFLAAVVAAGHSEVPVKAAENCTLHEVAALKLQPVTDGSFAVPVTLGGKPALFNFDISAPFSYVLASFADAAGFEKRPMPNGVRVGLASGKITGVEVVPFFSIGNASGSRVHLLRAENSDMGSADLVGVLAMDILSSFDIEVDVSSGAANLFTHDHCPGKVVYWSKEGYAEVPYHTDASGHPTFEMQLDGKPVIVALTTEPGAARMGMAAARRLFGIDEKSAGLTTIVRRVGQPNQYRYPFKALAVNGVSISNPAIALLGSSADQECKSNLTFEAGDLVKRCFGGSDLRLGLQELRALHIFMAVKEKTLYVTAAETRAAEPRKITPQEIQK